MPALPTGTIVLWFGSVGSVPAGWSLCNGTAGTPDLRDKFIIGAGDTYDPDDTGGTTQHTHDFTTDGHHHDILGGTQIDSGIGFHTETDDNADTGTTDPTNHLPPYHALAYIMKN